MLYNLSNLGVGGVSRHPIGPVSPQVKGVFQKKPILIMYECEVDWVKPLGMGFVTYKGSYCFIYGCLCRGCVAPSFSMDLFSKPIYLSLIN
jgi:hypothetical protein